MKSFKEWTEDSDRKNKLTAMRRWMWDKEFGNKKESPPPVSGGDPDYEWIKQKAYLLGPLDPHKMEWTQ